MRRLAPLVLLLIAALPATSQAAGRCGDHPWCDTKLAPEVRADLLLAELTTDEKVGLLAGDEFMGVLTAQHGTHTGTSEGVPRLDLPAMYLQDGPVGVRSGQATAMPVPMGLAATFDPKMARLHGQTIGVEARAKGNDVIYAPTVNLLRTPLWGRAFETYGEDPYLTSRIGVHWIEAAQETGVIANIKHYAANNQEGAGESADTASPEHKIESPGEQGSRFTVNVNVSERVLRELYLPQYETAIKEANVGSVMCAYPRVRGAFACENEFLLEQILRDDWGFKGFVLADYGAAKNTAPSLTNGLDFDPWPAVTYSPPNVMAALAAGQASQEDVDGHIRWILRTLFAYGFFDREGFVYDDAQIDKKRHMAAARRVEEGAITLLRNKGGTLPLDAGALESIAVIGSTADYFFTGGGSAKVVPFEFISPLKGIQDRAGDAVDVRYDDGSDPERAAALAADSDVAVVVAADYQTEFVDRRCISLQCPPWNGDQDALIETVAAANAKTVVVLETGGPVLTPWREKVPAIVEAWYPGSAGGAAIARVLFGDVDPGGRLPATFPRTEEHYPYHGDPEAYPGVAEEVHYKEGVLVGYRWFDEKKLKPAYPFGHGLSYTRFRFSRVRAHGRRVSADVKNVGARRGIAVPQLYLSLPDPGPGVVQPPLQLKGFQKLRLRPGQKRRVTFRLKTRDFSYWDEKSDGWRVAPGCYRAFVGASSRAAKQSVAIRPAAGPRPKGC